MKQIFWDWNGTLLDDVWYCIRTVNRVFPPMGIQGIASLEQYHKEFTFPVQQYYKNLGVPHEKFIAAAQGWMAEYTRCFDELSLFPDAIPTLAELKKQGCTQVMLSASQADMLQNQVSRFPLGEYFSGIYGIQDIYAESKVALGKACLEKSGIAPEDSLMIGDTLHDVETAAAMGIGCILVSRGHQPRNLLLTAGVPVLSTLAELPDFLLSRK